ncbi:bifunctional 5,10-methylenetetrahydrofolate dehydrogenase/5,10-methenyltetrahydrofolate cyclohydrolase [Leucobacter sp. PH1c]|uniref:bifunctional 5,10-methylenetetrahydrofolate dehydrogenase/5,10-methenyltetrahydrofolate cyclohydrolase n=1 Tax=Leucobacter sp. PH1c TaxID=1397278 RepID=UPI0009DD32FC|nr:bifunctional 5,10-methylenetetrahydrofolate dehydrogenase/5,10-methenyltetrahydrofolate cyclohydrolase [Leucobacter sp. PH1c]
MTAQLIHGRPVQQGLVAAALAKTSSAGVLPRVALLSVASDDPMLAINRELHLRTFAAYGVEGIDVALPADATLDTLLERIHEANDDQAVHGVMVLMPLPSRLSIRDILPAIDPRKELEGLHPEHTAGLLPSNRPAPTGVLPLVGEAVILALAEYGIPLESRNIVLLTEEPLMRSNPVANVVARCVAPAMLPPSSPLAIVPIDHPQARRLASAADVLIVSLERPEVVSAEWVKPGATVIDFNPSLVGFVEREDGTQAPILRGGIATEDVASVAGHILPVPGGIGPVMLGVLIRNAALAALASRTP